MFRRSTLFWNLPQPVWRSAQNYPRYEVCIIGGGPAGVAAAMRAASIGKRVCIVEAGQLGGKDIWNGTLQSKVLWEMSKFVSRATTSPGYVDTILDPAVAPQIVAAIDGERIRASLRDISERREAKLRELVARSAIDIIQGKATFNTEHEVDIKSQATGEYQGLSADYFIIATGSTPKEHAICPTDHRRIINSDDIFRLSIPKSLVIVGAGPMGCEFASMYANLGLTKVFLVDRATRILPNEDDDVTASVQESLARRGVTVHQNCHLFELKADKGEGEGDSDEGGVQYSVQNATTGSIETNVVERALVTVGRSANFRDLGLENTQMRVSNDSLVVDEFNRCLPYKHIYCIGDASGDAKLVNMAQTSARAAVQHMYGLTPPRVANLRTISNVSTAMYLDEEVACVGLNETQCQQRQIGYLVGKYQCSFLARAQITGDTDGFVKLIVTNNRQKRVLGVRAIGSHAASVVETASLAIRNEQSVYDLLKLNPSYPSMALGLVECARMLVGRGSWNSWSTHGDGGDDVAAVREWRPKGYTRGRAYY